MATAHPYSMLKPEYEAMLATMRVTREAEVNAVSRKLTKPEIINKHLAVSQITGVPAIFYAVAFEREASSNFSLALGQGDPWNQKSRNVPRNMGPFQSWEDAAIFYTRYDKLDIADQAWTMPYLLYRLEAWNGFGPRNHGRFTGYLWSGTQHYDPPTGKGGKYKSDGVWDASVVDKQLGCVPLIVTMLKLYPSLALPGMPATAPFVVQAPAPTPVGVGGGLPDALWLQSSLNKLGYEPALVEDGSYGRRTAAAVTKFQEANHLQVDGLAGPRTMDAVKAALDAEFGNVH